MWGRQREAFSMYKRMSSRDNSNVVDVEDNSALLQESIDVETTNPSWRHSFPHVLVAIISSFLFGYHLGVVNEPLESISLDLGFNGNTLAEGLVVSTCLGGAFIGSLFSGWIADEFGRRRAFQLCALPMIVGASVSATTVSLAGMLLGRFLVGTGMGLGPPVVALYVTEVSPAYVRGTYGGFIQIATCLGLMGALFIGIPVKEIAGWWRICFWLSTIPAAILVVAMVFCAESPHWLYKQGRTAEAEVEFERLLGGSYVKYSIAELSKLDRGDDTDTVKIEELFRGRYFRVVFIGSTLFALQQLSGINAIFYFSSSVFKSAGVSSKLANVFIGIANLIGSVVAMILMDKLGRKVLLQWSFFGMAVSMALQVTASSSYMLESIALYLSVGGMLLFVLTFALGAGPVPSLLLPEIFPSRTTSTNQFSARGRMGVRSRYVDTFNQGSGTGTPAKLFQSPSIPSVKPAVAGNAKFFVPAPVSSAEQPMEAIAENVQEENANYERPSTSSMNDSFQPATSSMTKQRFPSMDNIPTGFMTNGNRSLPAQSRRTASWSGSFSDSVTPNMTGTKPGEAMGMSPSSFMPSPLNGGSFGDDLHEVEL